MNVVFQGIVLVSLVTCFAFQTAAHAQPIPFRHVSVDSRGPLNPWGKSVGDLDGDGLTDLVVGGSKAGGLVWYQNPNWTKQIISDSGRWSTDHQCIDIDGDGDQDIVALSTTAVMWLENPMWESHVIEQVVLHDLEVADFDGDGDYDIVGRDQGEFGHSGETLHFFTQDALDSWSHQTEACPDGEGLAIADMDADGDMDIVINSVWFENLLSKTKQAGKSIAWKQHRYAPRWMHAATFVSLIDLNLDGNLDIILSPSELAGDYYRISWFEAPGNPVSDEWLEHPIALNVESVHHFVGAADLDLDGDVDVVTAEMEQGLDPDELAVFRNQGDDLSWQKEVFATTGSHSMQLVDVEGDGDIDLFGANHQGQQIDLWINETRTNANQSDTPEAVSNSNDNRAQELKWTYINICSALPGRCFGIAAADTDGDGDRDLAIGQTLLINPGRDMTSAWRTIALGDHVDANAAIDLGSDGRIDILAQRLPEVLRLQAADNSGKTFTEQVIADGIGETGHGSSQGFAMGDLTGDGIDDYVLTTGEGIFVVPTPSDLESSPWPKFKITDNAPEEGVALGDIDRDGWQDVIAWIGSGSGSNDLGWWRNPGALTAELTNPSGNAPEFWELQRIGSVEGAEGDRVSVGDFNQDGYLDVVGTGTTNLAEGSCVYWFQNPGSDNRQSAWQRHPIVQDVGAINSMSVADLNGDEVPDVVTGEHRGLKRVCVWLNVENGKAWTQSEVDRGKESHLGTQLFDLDLDGDLDLVSIGWDDYQHVHLWRNDSNR